MLTEEAFLLYFVSLSPSCLVQICCHCRVYSAPLPTNAVWRWVILFEVTAPRVALCRSTAGISSEPPVHLQSSRQSWAVRAPAVLPPDCPGAASEKCDPAVGKPSTSIPAESPAINRGPLTSPKTARLAQSRQRQILLTLSDCKKGNSDVIGRQALAREDQLWRLMLPIVT